VYARDDLVDGSRGGEWLSSDDARRIATGIAQLPELMGKPIAATLLDGAEND
jgi:hypothetical protein